MTRQRRPAHRQAHPLRAVRAFAVQPTRAAVSVAAITLLALGALVFATGVIGPRPIVAATHIAATLRSPVGTGSYRAPASPTPVAGAASSAGPPSAPTPSPVAADRFGLGLLIADRGNGRLLIVNAAKKILWRFPTVGSLPPGQQFSADDAFLAPDGRTIVANDEVHQVIDRIDIVARKVIWQYGHYGHSGSAIGYLHTPDDAYPLANGDVTVADIRNCRILEIDQAKQVVRQWGHTSSCRHHPPASYDNPNGDTPLRDGGLLITEIGGSRVVRLDAIGHVVFDIHVPVAYPSDAQLDQSGNVIVVDYSTHGGLVRVSPAGKLLWRYRPQRAIDGLNHPSLAIPLSDGTIALNDDFRHRVVVIDPATDRIVWQYGQADAPGTAAGRLNGPDGLDLIPIGTRLR